MIVEHYTRPQIYEMNKDYEHDCFPRSGFVLFADTKEEAGDIIEFLKAYVRNPDDDEPEEPAE